MSRARQRRRALAWVRYQRRIDAIPARPLHWWQNGKARVTRGWLRHVWMVEPGADDPLRHGLVTERWPDRYFDI